MSEKILQAEFGSENNPLIIGDIKIPCYVLEDGTRVITQTGMLNALGLSSGSASAKIAGDRLSKFVDGKRIKPLINKDIVPMIINPIKFKTTTNILAYGYKATVLQEIVRAVSKAFLRSELQKQQQHIGKKCEILDDGFSKVGIIALVDEATGYQKYRKRQALQEILDKYITDEWAKWTKTFPDEFYEEMFRLKNIPYPPRPKSLKKPSYVGHWTNDIIYSRLAYGILDELKKINPRLPRGYRKRKFHQYLTRDIGHPILKEHLSNVIFLMKSCTGWNDFKRRLNRSKPKIGEPYELPLDYGDDNK